MPLLRAPIRIPVFYYRVGRRRLHSPLRLVKEFVAVMGQNGQIVLREILKHFIEHTEELIIVGIPSL